MELSRQHRTFLLWKQGLGSVVLNFGINVAISWTVFRKHEELTLWGETGVGIDLLATGFLLPFLTCLILSRVVVSQVRNGKLATCR